MGLLKFLGLYKEEYLQRIFNGKAFSFPTALKHVCQLFNFCIFIKLFIQSKENIKVLGLKAIFL